MDGLPVDLQGVFTDLLRREASLAHELAEALDDCERLSEFVPQRRGELALELLRPLQLALQSLSRGPLPMKLDLASYHGREVLQDRVLLIGPLPPWRRCAPVSISDTEQLS